MFSPVSIVCPRRSQWLADGLASNGLIGCCSAESMASTTKSGFMNERTKVYAVKGRMAVLGGLPPPVARCSKLHLVTSGVQKSTLDSHRYIARPTLFGVVAPSVLQIIATQHVKSLAQWLLWNQNSCNIYVYVFQEVLHRFRNCRTTYV